MRHLFKRSITKDDDGSSVSSIKRLRACLDDTMDIIGQCAVREDQGFENLSAKLPV
jgi:hypothetical protein